MMGSGLLLTTGALVSLVVATRVYQATARIWIDQNPPSDLGALSTTNTPGFDPYWIQTESERIQGKVILYPVITNLSLTSRWVRQRATRVPLSMEEAYRLLIRKVEVRQLRSTKVFEVVGFSENPAEAEQIANTIARVYRDQRNAAREVPTGLPPTTIVQIVDAAERPSRPSREKNSPGLLSLVLFGVGMVDILVGYFVIRPELAPQPA